MESWVNGQHTLTIPYNTLSIQETGSTGNVDLEYFTLSNGRENLSDATNGEIKIDMRTSETRHEYINGSTGELGATVTVDYASIGAIVAETESPTFSSEMVAKNTLDGSTGVDNYALIVSNATYFNVQTGSTLLNTVDDYTFTANAGATYAYDMEVIKISGNKRMSAINGFTNVDGGSTGIDISSSAMLQNWKGSDSSTLATSYIKFDLNGATAACAAILPGSTANGWTLTTDSDIVNSSSDSAFIPNSRSFPTPDQVVDIFANGATGSFDVELFLSTTGSTTSVQTESNSQLFDTMHVNYEVNGVYDTINIPQSSMTRTNENPVSNVATAVEASEYSVTENNYFTASSITLKSYEIVRTFKWKTALNIRPFTNLFVETPEIKATTKYHAIIDTSSEIEYPQSYLQYITTDSNLDINYRLIDETLEINDPVNGMKCEGLLNRDNLSDLTCGLRNSDDVVISNTNDINLISSYYGKEIIVELDPSNEVIAADGDMKITLEGNYMSGLNESHTVLNSLAGYKIQLSVDYDTNWTISALQIDTSTDSLALGVAHSSNFYAGATFSLSDMTTSITYDSTDGKTLLALSRNGASAAVYTIGFTNFKMPTSTMYISHIKQDIWHKISVSESLNAYSKELYNNDEIEQTNGIKITIPVADRTIGKKYEYKLTPDLIACNMIGQATGLSSITADNIATGFNYTDGSLYSRVFKPTRYRALKETAGSVSSSVYTWVIERPVTTCIFKVDNSVSTIEDSLVLNSDTTKTVDSLTAIGDIGLNFNFTCSMLDAADYRDATDALELNIYLVGDNVTIEEKDPNSANNYYNTSNQKNLLSDNILHSFEIMQICPYKIKISGAADTYMNWNMTLDSGVVTVSHSSDYLGTPSAQTFTTLGSSVTDYNLMHGGKDFGGHKITRDGPGYVASVSYFVVSRPFVALTYYVDANVVAFPYTYNSSNLVTKYNEVTNTHEYTHNGITWRETAPISYNAYKSQESQNKEYIFVEGDTLTIKSKNGSPTSDYTLFFGPATRLHTIKSALGAIPTTLQDIDLLSSVYDYNNNRFDLSMIQKPLGNDDFADMYQTLGEIEDGSFPVPNITFSIGNGFLGTQSIIMSLICSEGTKMTLYTKLLTYPKSVSDDSSPITVVMSKYISNTSVGYASSLSKRTSIDFVEHYTFTQTIINPLHTTKITAFLTGFTNNETYTYYNNYIGNTDNYDNTPTWVEDGDYAAVTDPTLREKVIISSFTIAPEQIRKNNFTVFATTGQENKATLISDNDYILNINELGFPRSGMHGDGSISTKSLILKSDI